MGLPMREALRRLCLEFGWSYAVFWKATGFGRLMHLIWEDGYCNLKPSMPGSKVSDLLLKEPQIIKTTGSSQADDRICFLVYRIMASQVHAIGDGLIGQVASTAKPQWITLDKFSPSPKGFAELNSQLAASIQTVVVVPVLPFGVVQIGSTQLVLENIMHVGHIKDFFMKLKCGSRALSSNTKNVLVGKSHLYSSPVMLISDSQSTDIFTNLDNVLATNANACSPAIVSAPAPRTVTEFLSASSSQLNEKMLPGSLESTPSKHTINFSNPSGKTIEQTTRLPRDCVQRKLPAGASFGCQNESPLNSSPSNSLKVPEEVHILTPDIGASETTDIPNSFGTTKSFLKCKSSNSEYELSNVHSFPRQVNQCSNSCATLSVCGTPSALHKSSHSLRNPIIHDVPRNDQQFSINKVCRGATSAGMFGENNDLLEASCILSSESEVLASCSDFFSDVLQEYELTYPKPVSRDQRCNVLDANSTHPAENNSSGESKEYKPIQPLKNSASPSSQEFASSSNLFSMLGVDHKASSGTLEDVLGHKNISSFCKLSADVPKLLRDSDAYPVSTSTNDQISCSELLSRENTDQLLDAVISKINTGAKQDSDDGVSCKTSVTNNHNSLYSGSPNNGQVPLSKLKKDKLTGFEAVPVPVKTEPACSSYGKSSCSFEKVEENPRKSALSRSQINTWVEDALNHHSVSDSNSKKVAEGGKLNRKRCRPGENPRPRPKDRQMIQDRIKELRELVPNGAKCSIDALLEKTIKHMLFLQSVTEHADKMKVAGEPKISDEEEGGLLLKDNFEGGATWAFEVGAQPMARPTIVVEDLNLPRQMLVEMLCEERGFFLEIADFIRGLGLTILKAVMEAHKNKIWARFAVEANRDVTRMEIFLSLVRFLESTAGGMAAPSDLNMANIMLHQTTARARVV